MIKHFANRIKPGFTGSAIIAAALLVGGCSGGSGGSDASSVPTSPRAESTLSGSAIKGVIRQGLVSAYLVELRDGSMVRAENALSAPVRTDANGDYTLTVSAALENATLVVELNADDQTRMLCDVVEGCGDDADGNPVSFGEEFSLSQDFSMTGLVTGVNEGDTVNAYLSPLTHMMVARAESTVLGLTAGNILAAQSYIESSFDLASGTLSLAPVDITRLDEQQGLSENQLEMAVVAAAFLGLANSADWDSVDEVLDHVSDRLSSGAELTAVNMGSVRDVALDDVFYEANEIAEALVTLNSDTEYAESLAAVESQTQQSYESVTQAAEQVEPVQIVSQPAPVTIDEGGSAVFSVSAQGGGSLSFQWRLDGVALEGETASTLTVSSAELSDAGAYDVLVTNLLGSVVSLSALLEVNEVVAEAPSEAGSIALSWDIPTQREDGSDLSLFEINGYTIKYGLSSGNLTETVDVVGGGETEALIEGLEAGTYYFAIATVDSDGVEGSFSGEITQTVM